MVHDTADIGDWRVSGKNIHRTTTNKKANTTCSLQIGWSVELSNGSPYLLGLGISKSFLAFVWIAGPLSGTLVQPYVGTKSDRCRSRFGKRRPFMIGGAAATILSLMALAWTRELIGGFLELCGVARDSEATRISTITFAVLMIYILDFSINVIQAAIRAFIVDQAPTHQQDTANAWASRMTGVGNIVGYLFGYVDLPRYLWFFGNTQFKILCVIASAAMAVTLSITCVFCPERDPRQDGPPPEQETGVFAFFTGLFRAMQKLPTQIKAVCWTQFFAWIGWFPFLFYITTYIGEIYVQPFLAENPNMTDAELDNLYETGTRVGTFALLIFALTTFTSSVILPFIVASSYEDPDSQTTGAMTPGPMTPGRITPGPMTPGAKTPGGTTKDNYFAYTPANRNASFISTGGNRLRDRAPKMDIGWLTLRRAWMLSHILFALLCWATFFVKDAKSAIILVGAIGVPWAMTNWAPFALIAGEISKRENIRRGLIEPPPTREGEMLARGEDPSEGADQAGVVLGIHNVSIAAPQVIATLASSVIFKFLQKPRGTMGDESVAWVLRLGGLAALCAAYMTTRVKEDADEYVEEE
jgi:solute carrier family 45 protein 1/2/4